MYNEEDAIAYILGHVPADVAAAYADDTDELLNIIDMIFDYYESNGMLDVDFDDDDDADEDPAELASSIAEYACRMLRKDPEARVAPEHVRAIVDAELQYEQSLLD